MKRKKWAFVPSATQVSSDHPLNHPISGTATFGTFPEIVLSKITFPEGPILLKYGRHSGPNKGFGFRHIWAEHFSATTDHDQAQAAVIAFVARILVPRTPIFYEQGSRAVVFRGAAGQVIVDLRHPLGAGQPAYTVVTAYVSRNAKGSRIGALA